MDLKKKVSGTAMGIPAGLGIGAISSLIITVAGAALTAWLIASESIGEETIGYAAMVILMIASAVGAMVSIRLIKRLRLQVCLMSGGCYYLTLLALTALLFGGQYQGMGITAVMVLIGCAFAAFWPIKNRR